ncbi:glycosyltransferase family 4 protein [Microbacterium sp. PM5]|uniref:glycosyltransferase family 4 protein n=1 Tax=Microbacterium sp. PM5 TaxID=2014534 RepID=UPI0013AF865F|nr:glycosyltransferase family 4 protein [Microbacterium sp. PM5]
MKRITGVVVLQLALPHYRQALVSELSETRSVSFLSGDRQFLPGVVLGVNGENVTYTGRNLFFLGGRFAWQRGTWRAIRSAENLVVELNPRILNSWLAIAVRKILRLKTVAWGHVFPRAGEAARSDLVRNVMRRGIDGMIVYTYRQRDDFRRLHPQTPVYVAANAIYSREELVPSLLGVDRTDFIVIGRIVENKKVALAAEAFAHIARELSDSRLVIIGDGPLRDSIQKSYADLVNAGRIRFMGEITSVDDLRELFGCAVSMIAPGYVGLNATQSLGFGVPVIYSRSEPHAPEIELLDEENSTSFTTDDSIALAETMRQAWQRRHMVSEYSEALSSRVRDLYSVETMAAAFREVGKDGAAH